MTTPESVSPEVRRSPDGRLIAYCRSARHGLWRKSDGYDCDTEDVADWTPLVPAVSPAPDTDELRHRLAARLARLDAEQWGGDHDFAPYGKDRESDSVVDAAAEVFEAVQAEREAGLRADLNRARAELAEIRSALVAADPKADLPGYAHVPSVDIVREIAAARDAYFRNWEQARAELARVSGDRTIPDDAAERLARLLYAATRTDARLPAGIPDDWVGEHGHVLVERGYDKTWIDYARKVLTDLGLSTTRTPPAPAATVVQWLPATYVNTAGGGGCANCNGYQPLGHEGKCYPYGQGPTPDRLPPNTRFVFSPPATAEPMDTEGDDQ